MQVAFSLFALVFISSADFIKSECGFPEQPKGGAVHVKLNQRTKQLTSETCCSENHFLVSSATGQTCVDGKWTGESPQCVEILPITEITVRNKLFPLSNCLWVHPAEVYSAKIKESRRLYAIRLKGYAGRDPFRDPIRKIKYKTADRSPEELQIVRKDYDELNNRITLFVRKYQYLKELQFSSIEYEYICEIEFWAYYDVCGHPEIPLHGQVQWIPDDVNATYRCDEGYHLEANVSTRYCTRGKWNGSERTCVRNFPEEASLLKGDSYITLTSICCVLLLLIIILLVVLFKKKRRKTDRRQDEANDFCDLTEDQNVAGTEHYINHLDVMDDAEYAELTENIRENRLSRREWMERHSQIYAEVEFADSAEGFNQPVGQIPIYAQIDKSKKTKYRN